MYGVEKDIMRIAYLYEKKNHTYNRLGWYYWEFKYAVDFKNYKEKPRKIVTYRAYFQGEFDNRWDDEYAYWELSVYKDLILDKKETTTVLERRYEIET